MSSLDLIRRLPALAAMLLVVPGYCQTPGAGGLVPAGVAPTVLKLRDLDSSWWRVVVTPAQDAAASGAGYMQQVQRIYGSGQPAVYFTQGKTMELGGRSFLVAYQVQSKPLDFAALAQMGSSNQPQTPQQALDLVAPAPTPDSPLSLTLVSMSSIASAESFAPFDLAVATQDRSTANAGPMATMAAILFPVFAQARLKAQETSSVSNLKQMDLAALMYSQDYDEVLPPTRDLAALHKALYPYSKNNEIFVDPRTHEPYHANPAASRKPLASIDEPARFVLFYEAKPAPDGKRAVAFCDGHVKRVDEAEWQRLRRASGMQ